MLTKERWLVVRDLQEMPWDVWFEYYKESGGLLTDIQEFIHYFSISLIHPHILSTGRVVAINLATATHRIHEYFNKKFGL